MRFPTHSSPVHYDVDGTLEAARVDKGGWELKEESEEKEENHWV